MPLITQSDSPLPVSPSRGVFAAATLAELKTFTVPLVNQTVEVDGSISRGDGLAGTYYWNATDSRADNGTTIIASNAGGVGRWNIAATSAANDTFTPAGAGAVARPVQAELRTFSNSPQRFGAVGNGIADDTAALALWATAMAGKAAWLPVGTYPTTAEVLYNAATGGPIDIYGDGPNSILLATGVSNKALHITGTAGVTVNPVSLRNFSIQSATSGTASAGLHLDGIAHWLVSGVWIDGKNKITTGMQLTGAQQGEVSGGQIQNCVTNGLLEISGAIPSNGIDWHGMTFVGGASTTTNFLVSANGADDLFFHANHLTGASMQIDSSGRLGMMVYVNNHIEPVGATNDGMIIRAARHYIAGNTFYGPVGRTDINLTGGASSNECKIIGNLIDANVTIGAGVANTVFAFNSTSGSITDSGTTSAIFGNRAFSGSILTNKLNDPLNLTGALFLGSSSAATNFLGLNRTVLGAILNSGIAAYDFSNDGTVLNIERFTGAGVADGALKLGVGGAISAVDAGSIVNFSVSTLGVAATRDSLTAANLIAIPAGGTAGKGVMVSSTANFGVFFGSGAPTLSAAKGSLYLRSDGTTNVTRMFVNTDGGTTWTAVNTVA